MKKLNGKNGTSVVLSLLLCVTLCLGLIAPVCASETPADAQSTGFDAAAELAKAEQAAAEAADALQAATEALEEANAAQDSIENSDLEHRVESALETAENAETDTADTAQEIEELKNELLGEEGQLTEDSNKEKDFIDAAAVISELVTDSKAAAEAAVEVAGEAKNIAQNAIDAAQKAADKANAAKDAAEIASEVYNKILQNSVDNGNKKDIPVALAENTMIEAQEAYAAAQQDADTKQQEAAAAQAAYDSAVEEIKTVIAEAVAEAEQAYQTAMSNAADALAALAKAEADFQEALKSGSDEVQRAAAAREQAKEAAANAVEAAKEARKVASEVVGQSNEITVVAQEVIEKVNNVIAIAQSTADDTNAVMAAIEEKEFHDKEQRDFLSKKAFAENLVLKLSEVIEDQAAIDALLATLPEAPEWDVWRAYVGEMVICLKENDEFQKAMDAYRESELNRLAFLEDFTGLSLSGYASAEDAFQNDEQVRSSILEKLALSPDFTGALEDAFQAHNDAVMTELLEKIEVDAGNYESLQAAYDANVDAILRYMSENAEEYAEYAEKVKAAQDAYNKALGIAQRGDRENLTQSGAVNNVIIVQQGSTYTSQLTDEFTLELANAILKEWQKTGYQGPEVVNGADVSGMSLEEKAMAIANSTKAERANNGQYYEQNAGKWEKEANGTWVYEVKWGITAGNTVNGQQVIAVDFNNANYNSKLPVSDTNPRYISYIFVLDGKYSANDTVYLEFTSEMLSALGWSGSGSNKTPNQVVTKRIVYQEDLNAVTQEAMKDVVSISPAATPADAPASTANLPSYTPGDFEYNSELSFSGNWELTGLEWFLEEIAVSAEHSAKIEIPVTEPEQEPEVTPVTEPEQEPEVTPVTEPEQEPEVTPVTEPEQEPEVTPVTEPEQEPEVTPVTEPEADTADEDTPVVRAIDQFALEDLVPVLPITDVIPVIDPTEMNIEEITAEDLIEINDEDIPLGDLIEILDEDIPLGNLPSTGETNTMLLIWVLGLLFSVISLVFIGKTSIFGKKAKSE